MEKTNLPQKSIKKNAILNVCKTLTTTLFPIVTYMYVSRIFGTEGYGKISFSNSIAQYFMLFAMLGIANYATSEAAKVRDDRNKFNQFVSEIMLLNVISMIMAYILLFLVMKSIQKINTYQCFIMVYSVTIILKVMGMEWLYSAMEDYLYITIRTISVQVVLLICVFAFIHTPEDLLKYSVIQVAAAGGSSIFNLLHARKYVVPVKVTFCAIRKHLKPVFTLFLMTLFINLFTQLDSTMVGMMQNDSAVGLYAAGDKMSSMVAGVIGAISAVMLPRIAYYRQQRMEDELIHVIVKVVNAVILLSLPAALGIFLLSESIILIFSGSAFAAAVVTVKILSLRVLLSPLNGIFVLYVFIPLGKEKISMFVTAMAALANFIVNLVLIPILSYNGAAFATVFAEAVEVVFIIAIAGKFLPLRQMFGNIWQYLLASVSILFVWAVVGNMGINYVMSTFLMIAGSMVFYFAILVSLKNEYAVYVFEYLKREVRR